MMNKRLISLICSFIILALTLRGETTVVDSLLTVLKHHSEDSNKVNTLNALTWEYSRLDIEKMQDYGKQALALSNIIHYPAGKAKALYYLGIASLYKGDPETSYAYYEKANKIAKEINHIKLIASTVTAFGIYHHEKGELALALKYYLEGQQYAHQLSDTIMLCISNYNIGLLYSKMEQKEKALRYYQKAAEMGKATKNHVTICMAYSSLGAILEEKGQLDEAMAYYQDGLDLAQKKGDKYNTALMLMSVADVQSKKEMYEQAVSNYKQSYALFKEIGNDELLPYALEGLSDIYTKMEDFEKAIYYSQEGLEFAEELKIGELMPDIYQNLSEAYAGAKDFEKAYTFHRYFQQARDSIVNETKARQMADLESSFNMAREKTENQLLKEKQARQEAIIKSRNTVAFATILGLFLVSCLAFALFVAFRQKQAYNKQLEADVQNRTAELLKSNAALKKSNAELERFAYIASHDLKEPLRNIVSFSKLIDRRVGGSFDDTTRDYLEFVINNAKQMHILIENVLEFSRIGHTRMSFEEVELIKTIRQVEMALNATLVKKNAAIYFELLPRIYSKESQIYLLFKNLIENAIRYNDNDLPIVRIRYIDQGEHHYFMVEDNGIGIDEQYQEQIFEMFKRLHNRDEYQGSGLGLAICKKIVNFLGGDIWVESKPGSGSRFCFQLPVDPTVHQKTNRKGIESELNPN